MSKIKFSYCVNIYESDPKYTIEALNSIYKDCEYFKKDSYEIILVDDCSSSENFKLNIAEINSNNYENLHIYQTSKNLGMGGAINFGFEKCKGKYVFRLDGDDINVPGRTQSQLNLFDKYPHLDFVSGSVLQLSEDEKIKKVIGESSLYMASYGMKFGLPFHHSSIAYNKEKLGNYLQYLDRNSYFSLTEDYEQIYRLLFDKKSIFKTVKSPVVIYRSRSGSLSTQNLDIIDDQRDLANSIFFHKKNFSLINHLACFIIYGFKKRHFFYLRDYIKSYICK